jgi:hypothetical protein
MGANAPYSKEDNMRKQGYTEEEIADMLACDLAIDRGENLFPLDPSLEVGAKKARRADRTDTPKPRERKPNEDRQFLLRVLLKALENHDDEGFGTEFQSEIINPEREFLFTYNGTKYKVILSAPRK